MTAQDVINILGISAVSALLAGTFVLLMWVSSSAVGAMLGFIGRHATHVCARVTVAMHLIVCGVLVLIAPRAVLRRLRREFEGL